VLALVLLAVVWAWARWLPPAYDFSVFFRPAVWSCLRGASPYQTLERLHNPPWILAFLLPFALPPEPVGRALLLLFSVTSVLWVLRSFRRYRLAAALTLLSFPCWALFWNGQLEALILLGVWLGGWAAAKRRPGALAASLLIMSLKPQETALVVILLLWHARHWRRGEWARVLAPLAGVVWLSMLIFRCEWLQNFARAGDIYRGASVNISWWWRWWGQAWPGLALGCSAVITALAVGLALPRSLSPYTLALMATANAVASPYVETHHLTLVMVLAWPWLLDRQPLLALLVYATSLAPLARLNGDQGLNWLDFIFPVTLMLALLFFYREQLVRPAPERTWQVSQQ